MDTIQDLYREFLAHSQEERLNIAVNAASEVIKFLESTSIDEDTRASFFFSAIGLFIAADGKVTRGEVELFNKLFGAELSANELAQNFGRCAAPEFIHSMDEIIDSMPDDDKSALCILGLAFLTSDGDLTDREVAIFEKILG